jgi:hypothetical protein
MKLTTTLLLLATAAASPAWAQQPDPHAGHHPPAATTTTSAATPAASPSDAAHADAMHRMHASHEKMKAAKTPGERKAAKAAHHEAMRDAMKGMKGDCPPDASQAEREACMETRMRRMQSMLDMMEKCMDEAPAA